MRGVSRFLHGWRGEGSELGALVQRTAIREREGVRWCEGRSGKEDRTLLDLLVTGLGHFKQLPGADRAQAQKDREENDDRHID